MAENKNSNSRPSYTPAKDLNVVVKFENDDSPEGKMRLKLAREIICQLILLGQKRGRPSQVEEQIHEVA